METRELNAWVAVRSRVSGVADTGKAVTRYLAGGLSELREGVRFDLGLEQVQ